MDPNIVDLCIQNLSIRDLSVRDRSVWDRSTWNLSIQDSGRLLPRMPCFINANVTIGRPFFSSSLSHMGCNIHILTIVDLSIRGLSIRDSTKNRGSKHSGSKR
jgi:hypothetical protein